MDLKYGLKILRFYSVTEDQKQIDRLSRAIERMSFKKLIDTIIILDIDQEIISNSLNTSLVKAIGNKVEVKTYFNLYEDLKEALPIRYAGNQFYNILPISKYHHNYFYLLWHKIIDILSAILGLSFMILLTPVILLMKHAF